MHKNDIGTGTIIKELPITSNVCIKAVKYKINDIMLCFNPVIWELKYELEITKDLF